MFSIASLAISAACLHFVQQLAHASSKTIPPQAPLQFSSFYHIPNDPSSVFAHVLVRSSWALNRRPQPANIPTPDDRLSCPATHAPSPPQAQAPRGTHCQEEWIELVLSGMHVHDETRARGGTTGGERCEHRADGAEQHCVLFWVLERVCCKDDVGCRSAALILHRRVIKIVRALTTRRSPRHPGHQW